MSQYSKWLERRLAPTTIKEFNICLNWRSRTRNRPLEGQMKVSDEVAIEINGMNKWYGSFHVLRDINLTVNQGERIVIAGPSGSGKSTLIRCLNALEEHQQGTIIVDGTELSNDLKNIDKIRSEVGMVFQHFNLFPAPDHSGKLHAGADLGAQDAQERGRRARDALSWKR